MKCPECKKGNLLLINTYSDPHYWKEVEVKDPYYKCDVCKSEFNQDDIQEVEDGE